jgi:hypothetical protein
MHKVHIARSSSLTFCGIGWTGFRKNLRGNLLPALPIATSYRPATCWTCLKAFKSTAETLNKQGLLAQMNELAAGHSRKKPSSSFCPNVSLTPVQERALTTLARLRDLEPADIIWGALESPKECFEDLTREEAVVAIRYCNDLGG